MEPTKFQMKLPIENLLELAYGGKCKTHWCKTKYTRVRCSVHNAICRLVFKTRDKREGYWYEALYFVEFSLHSMFAKGSTLDCTEVTETVSYTSVGEGDIVYEEVSDKYDYS